MIGFFPDPFTDELLYSVCARYSDYMRYPSKTAVAVELQGYHQAKAAVEIPWNLMHLVAALPPGNRYTVERLANNHTLLPVYCPFFDLHGQHSPLEMMKTSSGVMLHRIFSSYSPKISFTTKLKFCPICVQQDSQQFGEPYWLHLTKFRGYKSAPWKKPAQNAQPFYGYSVCTLRCFVECALRVRQFPTAGNPPAGLDSPNQAGFFVLIEN